MTNNITMENEEKEGEEKPEPQETAQVEISVKREHEELAGASRKKRRRSPRLIDPASKISSKYKVPSDQKVLPVRSREGEEKEPQESVKVELPVKRKREEVKQMLPVDGGRKKRRRSPRLIDPANKITSKYVGVHWNSKKKRWIAKRKMNHNQLHGGTFIDELEAARAADDLVRKHRAWELELNFPSAKEVEKRRKLLQKKTKHGFFGIVKSSNGKWFASRTISSNGKSIPAVCGKSRDDIEEAARDSDKIWLENGGDRYRVNFPVKQEVLSDDLDEEERFVDEGGRLIPGTLAGDLPIRVKTEFMSTRNSMTSSEDESWNEEFHTFDSIDKMKKKIANSKEEVKHWKRELKLREKQFKKDKDMLTKQLRSSEIVAAADRKALEAKYKKKLSDEKKKSKKGSVQPKKMEELKKEIQRNEEVYKLKLEVGRQVLLGEQKVNKELEARIEELKHDKKDFFKEIDRLRKYRSDELEKEAERRSSNLKIKIEHLEDQLKNKETMINDIKDTAELKLKYELLQKEIEMKKLKAEIDALKESQVESPLSYEESAPATVLE